MSETGIALLVMTVASVLPLLPAVALFKWLPSTSDVSGPFKGLQIKLGGSFGAYFLVFLTLVSIRPRDLVHFHTWTVVGTLRFAHGPNETDPNVNDVLVRFVPPRLGVMNQGAFAWEIPVTENASGQLTFPDLQLDLRDFAGVTIPLGPNRGYGAKPLATHVDAKAHTIWIDEPIEMRALSLNRTYAGGRGEEPKEIK